MTWSLLRIVTRCGHRAWQEGVYRTLTTTASAGGRGTWEDAYQREVPRTMEEMGTLMQQKVNSPSHSRILRVAIVGVPNAGKSTLINMLLNWKVVSVSSKVHTTQINARAVLNDGDTQVVFFDTPGLVTPEEVTKHSLEQNLLKEPELSLQEADMVAVIHDASNIFTRHYLHPRVVHLLALYPSIPSILLLNKIDKLKSKHILLDLERSLTEGMVGGKKFHTEIIKKMESLSKQKEKLIKKALLSDKKKEQRKRHANIHHEIRESACNECRVSEKNAKSDAMNSAGDDRLSESNLRLRDVNEVSESSLEMCTRDCPDNKDAMSDRKTLMEQKLQASLNNQNSWQGFQEVFMISALDGSGVDDFRDFLISSAYPGPWIFNSKIVTDQNPQEIALMTVREKFLDTYPHYIPYTVNFSIEHWDLTQSEVVDMVVRVGCNKEREQRLVIRRIRHVARDAEQELRNSFRTEVRLRINVVHDPMSKKTKALWRKSFQKGFM